MLLSVHVTSVLFLVRFNNFALTVGFYWSYTLLLKLPVLKRFDVFFNWDVVNVNSHNVHYQNITLEKF